MRILVDIVHPAHVHFFRHAIAELQTRGHRVLVTVRAKENTLELLRELRIPFTRVSTQQRGLVALGKELLSRNLKIFRLCRHFRPDVLTGIAGMSVAPVGWLLRKPAIVFDDTEHATLSHRISFPFATQICTPDCYKDDLGRKQVRYPGYHELAYLHPDRFDPDSSVLNEVGLREGYRVILLRFVSWAAAHDVDQKGLSDRDKVGIVRELERFGRVVVSSEGPLPPSIADRRFSGSPARMHHLLSYCSLYLGEGATMASEAAVLGVPSIYLNPLRMGYVEEQERKYGLLYSARDKNEATRKAVSLLEDAETAEKWQQRRRHMLDDKVDVTAWTVDCLESCISSETRFGAARGLVTVFRRRAAVAQPLRRYLQRSPTPLSPRD
ncbi:DUF354 domain-containing protein [Planctomycetota bacterium]